MSRSALVPGPIDIHAHVVVPQLWARTRAQSIFTSPQEGLANDPDSVAQRAARETFVIGTMSDMGQRRANMDAMGIGVQVLSGSLVHQCTYFLPPQESLALERQSNDWIADQMAQNPGRFLALGTVPLHAPELAAQELRRCMRELGFVGVNISTRAGEWEIGQKPIWPFWEAAAQEGALVYIHPAGNHDARFQRHFLWNSIGQSFEEAMAIASLMYEGVLDAFSGVKICISHGGGYMPLNMGRIDRNYLEKPATRKNMKRSPTEYLQSLWYDSCVYDSSVLRHLAEKVGVDRIVLGTDYPVGDRKPLAFIEAAGFSPVEIEGIMRANAERMIFS